MRLSALSRMLTYSALNQMGATGVCGTASEPGSTADQATFSTRNNPAGWAIISRLRTETSRLEQGSRNSLHALDMLQAADLTLAQMESTLTEMLALAQHSVSAEHSEEQQAAIQSQFAGLLDALGTAPASVDFNGTNPLTASGPVVILLADRNESPSTEIHIQTEDLSIEGLGLTEDAADPTYATLIASSDYGIDDPALNYIEGPKTAPAAELTFTFHGSDGDKLITIEVLKKESLEDLVDSINAEAGALVPGWVAAEAVQVAGEWVLKTTTYEPGEAEAPDIALSGNLKWSNKDPIQASHFAGQAGDAGSTGPLDVAGASTIEKIEGALAVVTDLRSDYAVSARRLTAARATLESAATHSHSAELRISELGAATEMASSIRRELLAVTDMALLFQANVTWQAVLQLLRLPSAESRPLWQ